MSSAKKKNIPCLPDKALMGKKQKVYLLHWAISIKKKKLVTKQTGVSIDELELGKCRCSNH